MAGDKELLNQYLRLEEEMIRTDLRGSTEAADAIRNEMDEVWLDLSSRQHAFLNSRNMRLIGELASKVQDLYAEIEGLKE